MAFIGADAGVDARLARREAARVGGAPRACSGAPERVEHVGVCFCLNSCACRDHKRANLAKGLVRISSWQLWLDSLCKFQWEICPSLGDMRAPSQVCRHCSLQEFLTPSTALSLAAGSESSVVVPISLILALRPFLL
jgi:hypothetical protein